MIKKKKMEYIMKYTLIVIFIILFVPAGIVLMNFDENFRFYDLAITLFNYSIGFLFVFIPATLKAAENIYNQKKLNLKINKNQFILCTINIVLSLFYIIPCFVIQDFYLLFYITGVFSTSGLFSFLILRDVGKRKDVK